MFNTTYWTYRKRIELLKGILVLIYWVLQIFFLLVKLKLILG
jgi:hypothetical protein